MVPASDAALDGLSRTGRRARRPEEQTFGGLDHLIASIDTLGRRKPISEEIEHLVAAHYGGDLTEVALREEVIGLLAATLETGREAVRAGLLADPAAGLRVARSFAHVTDLVVAGAWSFARALHRAPSRTTAERLSVVAVGGYGRGEMAPYSDVDLLFLMPYKQTAWGEAMVETMLYALWDLKLKVGHSVRSADDCLRLASEDITIRTALLEQRFLCGDPEPHAALDERLWTELFQKTGPEFVEAKIAERDARHARHGGSRYLLEPNIKESKGGLRDLQTLHWISRYLYRSGVAWELVDRGVFEEEEVQRFADAAKFLWAVRCHLHDLSGRAQEHLTFDRQVEIATRMGYQDAEGRMAVERFMHTYFRHAKNVGDLTRIFSAALEAQHAKAPPRFSSLLRALSFRSGSSQEPFSVKDGRLTVTSDDVFERDPANLLRLFHEAARLDAHIHPAAMRMVTRNLDRIDDSLRRNEEANRLFLEMLTDKRHGHWLLRLMNETDVLGRFVPEFGRVVAMMQFNMYHHYTVDEHTIQAISILNRIEQLEATEEHPVATEIIKGGGINRRVLYVAVFLHDLGKGSNRDHSEWGAEIAAAVCPRLGFDEAETEMVVWLVRHHLLMSDVAQKRDIGDPRTVKAFAKEVQSPQRLRLLLILTVCDIRGVGPGVWNNWKAQLLRKLYWDTRDLLTGATETASHAARIEEAQAALAGRLAEWPEEARTRELQRHYPGYWLGLDVETQVIFATLARDADTKGIATRFLQDEDYDITKACLYLADHPGVFSRMAGAFALAGANVVDARTYTTADGMVCTVFWIQDAEGRPFEESRLKRLKRTIERTMKGEVVARDALTEKRREKPRERSFTVPTRIVFDNDASEIYTVIEVNARDRLGLLHVLTRTLSSLNINIFSAIIATYGEHAVDVFYVKDLFGLKIRSESKQEMIRSRLVDAIDGIRSAEK